MKTLVILMLFSLPLFAQQTVTTLMQSRGNQFNPDTSVNLLMLYQNQKEQTQDNGFAVQEMELQFTADVDAYYRAVVTLGIHKEHHEEDEEGAAEEEEHSEHPVIHFEEIYIETIATKGFTLRVGQFYTNFGKYNNLHTHALPFIYRSNTLESFFGEEGLIQAGLSASALVPTSWFSDFTLQILEAQNESLFGEEDDNSAVFVSRYRSLWDLSDELTFELGLSSLNYNQNNNDTLIALFGGDFTFKWRPSEKSIYRSFIWSTELIDRYDATQDKLAQGVTTWMRHQFAQRWYAQVMYDSLNDMEGGNYQDQETYTFLFAHITSEFSALRLQYDSIDNKTAHRDQRVMLQYNISIGAHPAHQY